MSLTFVAAFFISRRKISRTERLLATPENP
jgi:hypothetical protein